VSCVEVREIQVAEAIMSLNALVDNLGKAGGVFLSPLSPITDAYHRPASMQEMSDFINRMNNGEIGTLFIHGVNPVFELPKSLGFAEALANVGTVISFATFPDETAVASDYIFPDRHGLESWGYQRVATGTTQSVLSSLQPVVTGVYERDTPTLHYEPRGTADVLIAAAKAGGDQLSQALPFNDEVEYIQSKLTNLVEHATFSEDPAQRVALSAGAHVAVHRRDRDESGANRIGVGVSLRVRSRLGSEADAHGAGLAIRQAETVR
jgi:hypothetical protein